MSPYSNNRGNFFTKLIHNFLTKMFQHPEYYNVKNYKRMRCHEKHAKMIW